MELKVRQKICSKELGKDKIVKLAKYLFGGDFESMFHKIAMLVAKTFLKSKTERIEKNFRDVKVELIL